MSIDLVAQLPTLPVLIPLIAAPLALLSPSGRLAWVWAVLVAFATLAASVALLHVVSATGPIRYEMGGWATPLGIEYRVDLVNALVLVLVSLVASVVFPFAYKSVLSEVNAPQIPAFYCALLVCMTGLMGVTITGDAFNVFVFLEIASLSTYALVAMGARQDRRALPAAFNYLIMGTIGATFFVIGLGLLYQATGTLNMLDLHARLAGQNSKVVHAGFAFIIAGIGLKLAMVPLHLWLPNAYSFAPSAVSAFLAATATKVAVYIMLRFLFTVFGVSYGALEVALTLFLILGLVGMFYASFVAVFRNDLKQILAFSSVAQIGYMLVGIALATSMGVSAALIHLFNHALMKAALFMAVGCVVLRLGAHSLVAIRGLGQRMPWTSAAIVLAGLSLVGVPLTAGFVSKYQLILAVFEAMALVPASLIVACIVASSLLAAVYVGRIVYVIVLRDPDPEMPAVGEAPLLMLVPLWIMVLANFYFGVQAGPLIALTRKAAHSLLAIGHGMGGAL